MASMVYKELLIDNRTELISNIHPSPSFWAELLSRRVITDEDKEIFTHDKPTREQVEKLLEYLQKRPYEDFKAFCTALQNTNQVHIVSRFLETTGLADWKAQYSWMVEENTLHVNGDLGKWISYGIALHDIVMPKIKSILGDCPSDIKSLLDVLMETYSLRPRDAENAKEHIKAWANGDFNHPEDKSSAFEMIWRLFERITQDENREDMPECRRLKELGEFLRDQKQGEFSIPLEKKLGPWMAFSIALIVVMKPEIENFVNGKYHPTKREQNLGEMLRLIDNTAKVEESRDEWEKGNFEHFRPKKTEPFTELIYLLEDIASKPKTAMGSLQQLRDYALCLNGTVKLQIHVDEEQSREERGVWRRIALIAEELRRIFSFSCVTPIRGSVIFLITCPNVEVLDDLWDQYKKGTILQLIEESSHNPWKNSDIVVSMDEEEYKACRRVLSCSTTTLRVSSPNEPDWLGRKLYQAAEACQLELVQSILRAGVEPDVYKEEGVDKATALHIATYRGHQPIVELLVQHGADVENKTPQGKACLYLAAEEGHEALCRWLLLSAKANVEAAGSDGATPLYIAIKNSHPKIVTSLLQHGADVDAKISNGYTPFMVASEGDHTEVLHMLAKAGADVWAQDKDNNTALHHAAGEGSLQTVMTLVEELGLEACVTMKGYKGHTPAQHAQVKGHPEVYDYLNNVQQHGLPWCLYQACVTGDMGRIHALLTKGVSLDSYRDKQGHTALQMLSQHIKQCLILNQKDLVESIIPSKPFYAALVARKVLTDDDQERITLNKPIRDQVKALIEHLLRKTDEDFVSFYYTLKDTNQNAVVDKLKGSTKYQQKLKQELIKIVKSDEAESELSGIDVKLKIELGNPQQEDVHEELNKLRQIPSTTSSQLLEREEMFDVKPEWKDTNDPRIILIRGQMHIGKSTFIKKIMEDWAKDSLWSNRFKYVFWFPLRLWNNVNKELSCFDLLMNHPPFANLKEDERNYVWADIMKNQDQVLLLFDEADQYHNLKKNNQCEVQNLRQALEVPTLLWNLKKKHLLKDASIVVTTRPLAPALNILGKFPRNITILGLTEDQINQYVDKFFQKDPELVSLARGYFHSMQDIFGLCYIPGFLWLTCTCLSSIKKQSTDPAHSWTKNPQTITQLVTLLLASFIHQHNPPSGLRKHQVHPFQLLIEVKESIWRLTKLAAWAMREQPPRLTFSEHEIEIAPEDIEMGLLICTKLPYPLPGWTDNELLSFINQLIMEYLFALRLVLFGSRMDIESLIKASSLTQYSVIFMMGLLEDPVLQWIVQALRPVRTRLDHLKSFLVDTSITGRRFLQQIQRHYKGKEVGKLVMIQAIFQAQDSSLVVEHARLVSTKDGEVYLDRMQISPVEVTALGYCLKHSPTPTKSISLYGADGMAALVSGLKGHVATLEKLNLGNTQLGDRGMEPLAELLSQAPRLRDLDLSDNQITRVGMGVLCPALRGTNLEDLSTLLKWHS